MSTTSSRRFPRASGILLAFLLPLLLCSCAGARHKPVFPVQGKVFYQGKPTPKAIVFFHFVGNADEHEPMPQGVVGADGAFQLSTYSPTDGGPAGQYTVTVVWKTEAKAADDQDNLLPARYMIPSTSGLTVQ